ncbi:MAG: HIT family protein [Francisella sp.]
MFQLDDQLKKDTIEICEYLDCKILLMNNSIVPWFIVVPFTNKIEWYQLDNSQQFNINQIINTLSEFIAKEYNPDKINIASIGNIVTQMHIHIVGRFKNDPVWPAPVWGNISSQVYTTQDKIKILEKARRLFV